MNPKQNDVYKYYDVEFDKYEITNFKILGG